MKSSFEFHFQEIFTGERVEIVAGDEILAQFAARTKFQTGLAHIEVLELSNDKEVTIKIEGSSLTTTLKIDATKPFVTVRMMDGHVQVDLAATRPGYL